MVAPWAFSFGPYLLVPDRHLLLCDGTPVRLGGRALDILAALVRRPGELVTKRELLELVWPDTVVEEGNLKVHVTGLRRVLGEGPDAPRYIATVIGRGYRFISPVHASRFTADTAVTPTHAARTHNLPTGIANVFGRTCEIESICRDLETTRLVSIVGAGGIGKTTVALAVCDKVLGAFNDGVWLVDLAVLKDPDLVPNAIAASIGVLSHLPTTFAAVCDHLRERELLLVLDSCEHIVEATSDWVGRLLETAPGVKILVTSREPLVMAGELLRRLPGLETPPSGSCLRAQDALAFPAVQLFVERATDRLESFVLRDADAPAVGEICRRLDGLALAIELAASRIDAFGVSGLLRQLDDRFRLLIGRRAGPERHRTLSATLDWSYGLLSPDEAKLLRAVSVFAGVFDIEGAAAVSGLACTEVVDALAHLAEQSLLAIDVDAGEIAYRLLETTRADCFERLWEKAEDRIVRQRHADHVCTVLERATAEWAKRPAHEWALDYGRVLDDLRDALAWTGTETGDRTLRIRLTLAGILLWNHFSLTEECRAHVSHAVEDLEPAGLAGTEYEMKLKLWLGSSTMVTRNFKPQTLNAMRRALEIATHADNTEYRLRCLSAISLYDLWTGGHEGALHTLKEFIAVAAASDPSALPEGEVHIAIAELFLGRLQDAWRRLESLRQRDLRYFNRSYDVRYLADTLTLLVSVLSHVQWLMGFPDTAARTAAAAIDRAHPSHHHLSFNNSLNYACAVAFWSGRHADCSRYVEQLTMHVKQHGIIARRPVAMFYGAALACTAPSASPGAVDDLLRAVDEFRNINHLTRMGYYLSVVADALARAGRIDEAQSVIEDAVSTARSQKENWCMPEVLRVHAGILAARGQRDAAESVLLDSMNIAQETYALAWRLRSANDLAKLWCASSRVSEAQAMLAPIYGAFTEGFETRDLLIAARILSAVPSP